MIFAGEIANKEMSLRRRFFLTSKKEFGMSGNSEFGGRLGKLRCIPDEGPIGGVCAGVAYYFGISAWIVRLALVICSFVYGVGVIPYLIFWMFVPNADRTPRDYEKRSG